MRWYSTQSQMYPLYVVFLVVLAIQPVDCDLLRCYSCSWSRDDTSRMFECMNGSDLEVTSNSELEAPTSQYISHAQCAQCRKQELYKGGKLVSLVRSCTLHHGTLDTDLLPVPGCTKHELRGAYSMSCVCEEHLCNSALSAYTSIVFHRRFYHTMAILIFLITRWVQN